MTQTNHECVVASTADVLAQLELKHPGLRIALDLAAAVVIASEVTALDTNLREEPT